MPRQQTRLNDKDFELLKKERMSVLGETGALSPPFGNDVEDFVKFHVYDMNDTYLKSGMSEDFENDGDNIKLKPGNDLRKVGFTRGDYKVKYLFYRRMAGADEVVLTKSVGDESGIVHSGNPQLTGVPMGLFYVDEDGKVFEGEKPPADGSPPSELDVKEYKFFIDEISADRTEVRLAPQVINLDKYKDEFSGLSDEYGIYTPVKGFGSFMMGGGLNGLGKFGGIDSTAFQFDTKAGGDTGFKQKYVDGTLEVENAFVIGYTEHTNTNENGNWSLEDPIPVITIESNYPDGNATTGTPVIFTAKRENGNVAPSQLSYYWDFGCGHQEFGGPEISHEYTIGGNMNVSAVINSPNFVDTVTYGSLVVTHPPGEGPEVEVDTTLEYIPDGVLVQRWNAQASAGEQPTGYIYLIEEGKKRKFGGGSSYSGNEIAAKEYLGARGVNIYPQQIVPDTDEYEDVAFDMRPHIRFLDGTVINAIPPGPDFTDDDLAGQATIPFYNITVEAGTGGTVSGQGGATTGGSFIDGSTININAVADDQMEFVNWTNAETDSSGNQNTFTDINSSSTSVEIKANSTITANFQASTTTTYYNITLEAGTGGTVTGGGNVEQGTVINISANPSTDYVFSSWIDTSGANSSVVITDVYDATTTATVNSDATIEAHFNFVPATYQLRVQRDGMGGQVSIDDGDVGTSAIIMAAEGTTHTLHAWPDESKRVHAWDGDSSNDDDEITITMPDHMVNHSVTFTFGQ